MRFCEGCNMRSDQDLRQLQQRVFRIRWLFSQYVEAGSRDLPSRNATRSASSSISIPRAMLTVGREDEIQEEAEEETVFTG